MASDPGRNIEFDDSGQRLQEKRMSVNLWNLQIPAPLALALLAAVGYIVSRWNRPASNDIVVRSRRELKCAQTVALELEKIAWTVRQSLAKHHSQRLAIQGAREPAERPTAGGRLERALPGGGRHPQAHAATGHADRRRLRRNTPAKRQFDVLHRSADRSADRGEQSSRAGRRL